MSSGGSELLGQRRVSRNAISAIMIVVVLTGVVVGIVTSSDSISSGETWFLLLLAGLAIVAMVTAGWLSARQKR